MRGIPRRRSQVRLTLNPSVSDKKPNDENDKQEPSNSAANRRTAVIVSATAPKNKQQNKNDEDRAHKKLLALQIPLDVFNHYAHLFDGRF